MRQITQILNPKCLAKRFLKIRNNYNFAINIYVMKHATGVRIYHPRFVAGMAHGTLDSFVTRVGPEERQRERLVEMAQQRAEAPKTQPDRCCFRRFAGFGASVFSAGLYCTKMAR